MHILENILHHKTHLANDSVWASLNCSICCARNMFRSACLQWKTSDWAVVFIASGILQNLSVCRYSQCFPASWKLETPESSTPTVTSTCCRFQHKLQLFCMCIIVFLCTSKLHFFGRTTHSSGFWPKFFKLTKRRKNNPQHISALSQQTQLFQLPHLSHLCVNSFFPPNLAKLTMQARAAAVSLYSAVQHEESF